MNIGFWPKNPKANFQNAQMNVSFCFTMNYEQITMNNAGKNKAKTNPIQTQTNPIGYLQKMNVYPLITKSYEILQLFGRNNNEPKTNPNLYRLGNLVRRRRKKTNCLEKVSDYANILSFRLWSKTR